MAEKEGWERYKEIYTDVWGLHKKYYGTQDYDTFVEEFTKLGAKYNHPFCENLLIAVAEDISRNDKGSKGE